MDKGLETQVLVVGAGVTGTAIARELDIPITEVSQKGGLSQVLLYRSKELLG